MIFSGKMNSTKTKGTVVKSTGSHYQVLTDDNERIECRIKGTFRLKGIKNTNPIAVGDRVEIEINRQENTNVITALEERKNYIIRKSVNLSKQTHILAANLDQLIIIATLASPRTSAGFIDRLLVTAEAYAIPSSIVFNKMDLYGPEEKEMVAELINVYTRVGYKCMTTSVFDQDSIQSLKRHLYHKTTLFSGHSGAGKSTLINQLVPDLNLRTAAVSSAHDKGIHTTTFAEMFNIDADSFIVDTPGIKELGIVDIEKEELSHFFPEMRDRMLGCKFNNCQHVNEPKCAVIEAVEKGDIALSRYHSYLSMFHSEEMDFK